MARREHRQERRAVSDGNECRSDWPRRRCARSGRQGGRAGARRATGASSCQVPRRARGAGAARTDRQAAIWGPRSFTRWQGEALHPEREPLETLQRIRRTVGEYNFAGQYQQSPAPLGGGMVKAEWFKRYRKTERPPSGVRPSQGRGSGRQRRSGMIGRDRQAARAVARSPRSTDRSEERGT